MYDRAMRRRQCTREQRLWASTLQHRSPKRTLGGRDGRVALALGASFMLCTGTLFSLLPAQLVERVTGKPPSAEPLVRQLSEKYGAVYGV